MQEINIYSVIDEFYALILIMIFLLRMSLTASLTIDYEIEVMIAIENKIFRVPDNAVAVFPPHLRPLAADGGIGP